MTRFQVELVGHRGDCWRLDSEEEVIQEIKKRYPDAILARDYWRNAKYAELDDQAVGKIVRFSGRSWQATR